LLAGPPAVLPEGRYPKTPRLAGKHPKALSRRGDPVQQRLFQKEE